MSGAWALPQTSESWSFRPGGDSLILEAFERLQIYAPALEDPRYIISAWRSLNLILLDISGNRGINLWKVGDDTLTIPLVAGQAVYDLPTNVVDILDTVLRQYTPSSVYQTIGNSLTPVTTSSGAGGGTGGIFILGQSTLGGGDVLGSGGGSAPGPGQPVTTAAGVPVTTASGEPVTTAGFQPAPGVGESIPMTLATGEPVTTSPSSGVFDTIAGSSLATMHWPFPHGLSVGSPLFFEMPVTLGPTSIGGPNSFAVVDSVIDPFTLSIALPGPAPATRMGCGGTPLFWTMQGSGVVGVNLANHGQVIGSEFIVQVPTYVGGLVLAGAYPVVGAPTSYAFQIMTSATATSSDAQFENGGQILVTSQAEGMQYTDTLMWPVSRNDYWAFPNKYVQGRPSVFWFDRGTQPQLNVWATSMPNAAWAFVCRRLIEIEDLNPMNGQQLDAPRRFYPAFVAELTAALAEKWKPEVFAAKATLAEAMWNRFASQDREKVSFFLVPHFNSYFR